MTGTWYHNRGRRKGLLSVDDVDDAHTGDDGGGRRIPVRELRLVLSTVQGRHLGLPQSTDTYRVVEPKRVGQPRKYYVLYPNANGWKATACAVLSVTSWPGGLMVPGKTAVFGRGLRNKYLQVLNTLSPLL